MISWLFPPNVSSYGGKIDGVINLIFVVVAIWFVVVQGVLIYLVVRYRRRPGVKAASVSGNTWRRLAWVLIPAALVLVCDLGIDAAGGDVWREVKDTYPPAAVVIHVTARQFYWQFTYPGPDGTFGSGHDLVEPTMHAPAGQVVALELESRDVIHDFFVPDLRLKQDVVPGRTIKAWFAATKTGNFEIACSQLCGPAHFAMRGKLVVESPSDFANWLAAERAAQAKKTAALTAAPRSKG